MPRVLPLALFATAALTGCQSSNAIEKEIKKLEKPLILCAGANNTNSKRKRGV